MQQTSKKVGVWFCRGLLVLSLFLLPSAFLSTFVYSQPETAKSILEESGVYTNISASIIEMSASSLQSIGSSYGISKEATDRVASKAFTSNDIQKKVEKLIDNGYGWLDGSKKVFVLELDLENNKQALISGLSEELGKSIESKPVCTTQQLQELAVQEGQSSSILQTCRPENLDINAFKADFNQAISAQQVPDAVAQAATSQLPVDSSSQSAVGAPVLILQDNEIHGVSVPFVFGLFKNLFYIALSMVILFALCLYALMRQPVPFIKALAHPLLTTGILLVVYALVTQWLIGQNFLSKLVPGEQTHLTEKTLQSFSSLSVRVVIYFGISYLVIALSLYIFAHHQKKKQDALKLVQEVTNTNTVV